MMLGGRPFFLGVVGDEAVVFVGGGQLLLEHIKPFQIGLFLFFQLPLGLLQFLHHSLNGLVTELVSLHRLVDFLLQLGYFLVFGQQHMTDLAISSPSCLLIFPS